MTRGSPIQPGFRWPISGANRLTRSSSSIQRAATSASVAPSPSGSVPPAAVQKPSDLVSSYLKALGTGDAQGALSMAAVTPTDTTMLTDEMLAKSTAGKLTDEMRVSINAGIPMGRPGTAEDVAGCALFLASDLSSYVTGSEVDVNGGSLIH